MTDYDDSPNEDQVTDDDDLSPEEKGFLKGYDEAYDEKEAEEEVDKEFE